MMTEEIVKFVLILFNLLCMVCGAGLTYLGTTLVLSIKEFSIKDSLTLHSVSIVTLCLGCVIFCISFVGCCGAINMKSGKLRWYAIVLFCLFICQVILTVFVWMNNKEIFVQLKNVVVKIWDQRQTSNPILHTMEKTFHCCGKNGCWDYNGTVIPGTCCGLEFKANCTANAAYPGCLEVLPNLWKHNSEYMKYITAGVSAVMLTASIFSSYLSHRVRNNEDNELLNN